MGEKTEFEELKKDLENLKYIEKADIENNEGNVLITVVDFTQEFMELMGKEYYEQREQMIKDIFKIFDKHNINIEEEEFEDNDTYFYIVSYLN